jgi:hypothetical protein
MFMYEYLVSPILTPNQYPYKHLIVFLYLENNHKEINTLEEIDIVKAASSKFLLNDVIAGQNDPIYKLLPTQ